MEEQKPLLDLRLDFKYHAAKEHDLKTCEPHPQHQGLSLPIDDRASIKKRLRDELKKEYNQFLQEQAQIRKLNRRVLPVTFKPEESQPSKVVNSTGENHHLLIKPNTNTDREHTASRTDAATLTEDAGERSTGTPGPQSRRRWNIPKAKGRQGSEDGENTDERDGLGCQTEKIRIPEEPKSSEVELNTDKGDQIDFKARRRQNRSTQVSEHRVNSADFQEMEASAVCNKNSSDQAGQTEYRKQTPDRHAESTVSSSNVKKEFATGLIIGATEEPTVIQMKKEQYRQELLRQIAEQRDNKLKEKQMEVAATGATDPKKEPDRIKRFGAELEQTDSFRQDVLHKPGADMEYVGGVLDPTPKNDKPIEDSRQSPPPLSSMLRQIPERTAPLSGMAVPHALPPLDCFSEDYNRALMHQLLGEGDILRFTGVPPLAPIVPNTNTIPYDGAHLYYGNGNYPFHLHPVRNQNDLPSNVEVQNDMNDISPKRLPPLNAHDCIDSPPSPTEGLHVNKSPLRRDNAVNYQEALRQQIKERESHKRREKEENERCDLKLQAEMNSFSPWGRGGGGAPIKDQNGNLISDLYQMHRINEEKRSTPGAHETGAQLPGFSDQSPQQQLSSKERLREEQKGQIEEKKRRQAEERARMRIIEEKEEERLAKERLFMKQNYEEEQRKLKPKNKTEIQLGPQIPQKEEGKSARLEKQRTQPITEKTVGNTSQLISEEQAVSAAHDRPTPERASPSHNGREEVIRELSALRRLLKTEQKKLEVQMGQALPQENHHSIPSRHPTVDASEGVSKTPQSSLGTPSSSAVAPVNKKKPH
ncbi:uncharacterized protein cspp1a isoform X4 [Oryzias latipes]